MKYTLLSVLLVSSLLFVGCSSTTTSPTTTPTSDSELINTLKGATKELKEVDEATKPQSNTKLPSYSMNDLEKHSEASSCRTVIRGKVYDLTAWVDAHPGGDKNILRTCGIDATTAFDRKHGGQEKPEATLDGFQIGTIL